MEGELQASSDIPVTKVLEKADSNADSNKITDGNLNPITIKGKKEDDETALESGFIKIEKEPLDGKDMSALENLLLSTNENLQVKESELEELKLKLREEVQSKEAHVSIVQEELSKVMKEKEALESAVTDLTSNAAQMKELCDDLETKLQSSDENFCKADSLLSQALANCADLEQKLKSLEELHHESGYAAMTAQQKNLELEDIVIASNAEAKEAKSQMRELETRFIALEQKNVELEMELEAFHSKSSSLEVALQTANEKERELTEILRATTEVKENLEDGFRNSSEKLSETETLLEVLRNELNLTQQKSERVEGDLKTAGIRESEIMEKLKSAEELETKSAEKFASLQNLNEELKMKISEVEENAAQFSSENELLVETNKQLKTKVNELQDLLNSAHAEKETTAEQLASHLSTIAELADKHSKASELHLVAESRISKAERELQEAIMKFSDRDLEAMDLTEKINALKSQINVYERQAHETSDVIESQKIELEQTFLKLKGLEGIIEETQNKSGQSEKEKGELVASNSKLMQELATYESKLNELEAKFSATVIEKDDAIVQLSSSKKLIEDLTKQFALEGQKVQSQRQKDSQKDSEREDALKRSFEAENEVDGVLEKRVKELEQKLGVAKTKQKDDGWSPTEIEDGMEVKSRDIGSTISTPSKRRSNKKLEAATSPQAPSAEGVHTHHQTTDAVVSPLTTFKIVSGVALVAIIIGVILGKRY